MSGGTATQRTAQPEAERLVLGVQKMVLRVIRKLHEVKAQQAEAVAAATASVSELETMWQAKWVAAQATQAEMEARWASEEATREAAVEAAKREAEEAMAGKEAEVAMSARLRGRVEELQSEVAMLAPTKVVDTMRSDYSTLQTQVHANVPRPPPTLSVVAPPPSPLCGLQRHGTHAQHSRRHHAQYTTLHGAHALLEEASEGLRSELAEANGDLARERAVLDDTQASLKQSQSAMRSAIPD